MEEMVRIEDGAFLMGSDHHYPEEAPQQRVAVDAFLIDPAPVTNRQFAAFVKATGYVTLAERPLNPADYPGAKPAMLVPGALVFHKTKGPVDLADIRNWWRWTPGACWRHPEGKGSGIAGRQDHPVVQMAYEDAAAYAAWCGKELPSEAEWEFAARGGLDGAEFAWGDELTPGGRHLANIWQGRFPVTNTAEDGYAGTAPVHAFPPNDYGLHNMAGNVWEWCADWWATDHAPNAKDPSGPRSGTDRVMRGGSYLCHDSYCYRYRVAARSSNTPESSSGNLGFRCAS